MTKIDLPAIRPGRSPDRAAARRREGFRHFAGWAATATGSHWAFAVAVILLVAWVCSYPLFRLFSDPFNTWQLVINTATTIITFLMVFLIQNTQNRDAKALHLKLDELIRAVKGARNRLVDLESYTDEELDELRHEFERIHNEAAHRRHRTPVRLQTPGSEVQGAGPVDRPGAEP